MFTCAFSGKTAPEIEDDDDDEFEGLPVGWVRIVIERRIPNPEYQELALVGTMITQGTIAQQVPPVGTPKPDGSLFSEIEARTAARFVELSNRALFAPILDATPEYIVEREVRYVSPPYADQGVAKALEGVTDQLGINVFGTTAPETPFLVAVAAGAPAPVDEEADDEEP